jgi:hypothetical protein
LEDETMTHTRRSGKKGSHGRLKGGQRPPEYAIWKMLFQRCENPRSGSYANYGGKGVRVCDRWRGDQGFETFLADVGPQPFPGAGLLRRDPAGDFEPGNVSWGKTRPRRLLTFEGRTQSVAEWAREWGVKAGTLRARLHMGWDEESDLKREAAAHWSPNNPRQAPIEEAVELLPDEAGQAPAVARGTRNWPT